VCAATTISRHAESGRLKKYQHWTNRGEERKIWKSGNKKRRQWLRSTSLRGKAGEGAKRMGCHLSNVYINNVKPVLDSGSTLSWTVIQLAASFWRISVTPLESLSYFSLGSSSLSSSWLTKWTCKVGRHCMIYIFLQKGIHDNSTGSCNKC